jgi:hypothetical protein
MNNLPEKMSLKRDDKDEFKPERWKRVILVLTPILGVMSLFIPHAVKYALCGCSVIAFIVFFVIFFDEVMLMGTEWLGGRK